MRTTTLILCWCVLAGQAAGQDAGIAQRCLEAQLRNPARATGVLAALRSTEDENLLPLFVSLSRSGDKSRRLFATASLGEIAGSGAAPALHERLGKDPSMTVRAEAMVQLLHLEAISAQQLIEALAVPDESVRCMTARALVQRGRADAAVAALAELAKSKDLATAGMARLSLLSAAKTAHYLALEKIFQDPHTPPAVLALLLGQIAEEKIVPAAGLAERLAASSQTASQRLRAYRAIAAVCPDATARLLHAIRTSDDTVFRVQLLWELAERPDAKPALTALSRGPGSTAALARFELARPDRRAAATRASNEALSIGHPVVVEYILRRGKDDLDKLHGAADFYAPALLKYVRSVDPNARRLTSEHILAARAVSLLAEMGTPAAMDGLRRILADRHSILTRVTATGLLRSKNKAVCELVRPLLNSPHTHLATDAALTLGRFGDADANGILRTIVAQPSRHSPQLVGLAAWSLLRIANQVRPAAESLAKGVQ